MKKDHNHLHNTAYTRLTVARTLSNYDNLEKEKMSQPPFWYYHPLTKTQELKLPVVTEKMYNHLVTNN